MTLLLRGVTGSRSNLDSQSSLFPDVALTITRHFFSSTSTGFPTPPTLRLVVLSTSEPVISLDELQATEELLLQQSQQRSFPLDITHLKQGQELPKKSSLYRGIRSWILKDYSEWVADYNSLTSLRHRSILLSSIVKMFSPNRSAGRSTETECTSDRVDSSHCYP